ncbi:MAG: hypothetical protein OEM94_09625 [Acidimicrobiia bacterium]|nr:hypothetical protein [Acidimicrobiia bacterium]
MKRLLLIVLVVALMMLGLMPAGAQAKKPLDVDCDLLATTITNVSDDTGLFADVSVGQLLHAAKKDPVVFPLLNGLLFAYSGEVISFDSVSQGVTTIAKCGLVKHLIDA